MAGSQGRLPLHGFKMRAVANLKKTEFKIFVLIKALRSNPLLMGILLQFKKWAIKNAGKKIGNVHSPRRNM
jgi:hypothetical protein